MDTLALTVFVLADLWISDREHFSLTHKINIIQLPPYLLGTQKKMCKKPQINQFIFFRAAKPQADFFENTTF